MSFKNVRRPCKVFAVANLHDVVNEISAAKTIINLDLCNSSAEATRYLLETRYSRGKLL